MKLPILPWLLLAVGLPVFGQAPTRVSSLNALLLRKPLTHEVTHVETGWNSNNWGGLREFKHTLTITGTTNVGNTFAAVTNGFWVASDKTAPLQDVRWFGAVGDGTTDDAPAINAAAAFCAQYGSFSGSTNFTQGGPTLVIPPIARSYRIGSTVSFPTSVDAEGANFDARDIITDTVVFVGVPDAAGYGVSAQTYKLPNILGRTPDGYDLPTVGVRYQNVLRSEIKLGYIQFVGTAWEAFGGTSGTTLNTVRDVMSENTRHAFGVIATNANSYVTGQTFLGMRMNNFQAAFIPGAETGYELGIIDAGLLTTTSINGNVFLGGSWEGFPSARMLYIRNASATMFDGIRLEHHAADFTPSIPAAYTSRYMEVEGTRAGVGIDNRWVNVSQASGLYGIAVKETSFADGNSGADSRGTIYGSRDQGFFHGGIVLQPTDPLGDNAGSAFTVYPYMAWPKHHETNYTEWTFSMNPLGSNWKNTDDRASRFQLLRTGSGSLYNGTTYYRQYWGWDSIGGVSWYSLTTTNDTTGPLVFKVDHDGIKGPTGNINFYVGGGLTNTVRFTTSSVAGDLRQMVWSVDDNAMMTLRLDPASKSVYVGANPPTYTTNLVRPATIGTQGGLELVTVPTNTLAGFYHRQRMEGVDAFAGNYHLLFSTNGTDYAFVEIGGGAPDHSAGWLRGAAGIAMNWSPDSTVSNIVLHTLPQEGRIEMRTGPGFNPAAYFDQSTNAGGTRTWLWVNNTNAPVQVKYSDTHRVFYGGDNQPIIGMAAGANITLSTNTTTGVVTITAGASGSGPTNGSAIYIEGAGPYSVVNFVTSADGGYSYSGTNGSFLLTTTGVSSGSYTNPTITVDSKGRITAVANGTAGGSGTAVSFNGGGTLTSVDHDDSAEIAYTMGFPNNWSASLVANSVGTNKLTSAAWLAMMNRTNHYGTQSWLSLDSLPNPIAQIAAISGSSGDMLYNNGTVWTNLAKSSTNGTVLTLESGFPRWAAATGGGGGVTDHGALTGLSDDDHPQYFQKTGGNISGSVYVGGVLAVTNGSPSIELNELDAAADYKKWRTIASFGTLYHQAQNDAASSNGNYMVVSRTGHVISQLDLYGTAVKANDQTIWTAGNDGTSSTLDADLLDGLSSSAFQAADTDLLRLATITSASGDVLYRDATGWTNRAKGSDGQVLTLSGGFPVWSTPTSSGGTNAGTGNVVFSVTNEVTVASGTTAETTLLGNVKNGQSKTIPANTITAGTIYRLDFAGKWSSTADYGGNTLRVYFGGRTITFESTAEPYGVSHTGSPFFGTLWLTFKDVGSTVAPLVSGSLTFQYDPGNASDKGAMLLGILSESGAVDTGASAAVDLTWDNGAQPMDITLTHALLSIPDLASLGSGNAGMLVNGSGSATNLVDSPTGIWARTNGAVALNVPFITKTIQRFTAAQGQPPAANYATFSTRNSVAVLEFDQTTQESMNFVLSVPEGYTNTTMKVVLSFASSATSGNYRFGGQIARLTGVDIDSDSYATAVEATTATSGTAGLVTALTLTGVGLDSAVAGDMIQLNVYRDTGDAADTVTSDMQLIGVEVRAE